MIAKTPQHYSPDALSNTQGLDVIGLNDASTLDELFRERVRRSPENTAFQQFNAVTERWELHSWAQIAVEVERWQVAFRDSGLVKGDRIALCFRNSIEWVVFDQAALRLGLVVVPLYMADQAENIAYVLADSRAKLVLLENALLWPALSQSDADLSSIETVLVVDDLDAKVDSPKVQELNSWLPENGQHFERGCADPDDLASIVYTSGTTGRPKGVMLSHKNMLANAHAGLRSVAVRPNTQALSFLPLSHTLERTVGYYASVMSGACVTFNRSIEQLGEDLQLVKPQMMIAVPRVFERIHNQLFHELEKSSAFKKRLFHLALDVGWDRFECQQGRAAWQLKFLLAPLLDRLVASVVRRKLGGALEVVIVGGAALSPHVAKTFIALGIPLLQGYGLTESSPVVSVNTLADNRPETIGRPLRGVECKIMQQDELWVRGDNVMLGYWGLPEATAAVMEDEWLKTGDRATLEQDGCLRIIGRIKDILVLANGERVPPADIEAAILQDSVFEQAMVLGEGKPFLSALVVLSKEAVARNLSNEQLVQRVSKQMREFPAYAAIRKVHVCEHDWSIENGLLTPTLKMKRNTILAQYQAAVDELYQGHDVYGA